MHWRPYRNVDDATTIVAKIQTRAASVTEIVQAHLTRIERWNASLGAYLSVSETALDEARAQDEWIAQHNSVGPLAGVPIAVKDLVDTAAQPTTYGGLHGFAGATRADAAVVRRLRAAGAIVIGKTNLHEYAFGTTNVNAHYGATRNPWNRQHITGGSSGGSSAALVANLCAAAIGTDTGGSIRIPAALTGHVGLKPTFGLISRSGVFPLAPSLDHVGPMTRSVRDAALLLSVLAGYDPSDPASIRTPQRQYGEGQHRPLRIGIATPFFWAVGEDESLGVVRDAIERIKQEHCGPSGGTIQTIDIPMLDEVPLAQTIILFSEASAVHHAGLTQGAELYGEDVRDRLNQGGTYSASEYIRAKQVQERFKQELHRLFATVDVIVTPTVPVQAPPIGQQHYAFATGEASVPSVLNRCTNPWNLAGTPALTLPCGLTSAGLPIGIQLTAPWFCENNLFQAAAEWTDAIRPLPGLAEYE